MTPNSLLCAGVYGGLIRLFETAVVDPIAVGSALHPLVATFLVGAIPTVAAYAAFTGVRGVLAKAVCVAVTLSMVMGTLAALALREYLKTTHGHWIAGVTYLDWAVVGLVSAYVTERFLGQRPEKAD